MPSPNPSMARQSAAMPLVSRAAQVEHRWAVIGAVVALASQALLVVTLIVKGRRRRRAQAAFEQQQQDLAHFGGVTLLGELSGAIARAARHPHIHGGGLLRFSWQARGLVPIFDGSIRL